MKVSVARRTEEVEGWKDDWAEGLEWEEAGWWAEEEGVGFVRVRGRPVRIRSVARGHSIWGTCQRPCDIYGRE